MNLGDHPGVLIAFEGIDGAGKTTQARLTAEALSGFGFPVHASREPTDGPHGRRLRASAASGRLAPADELALFLADRREHVEGLILPALRAGNVVLLDRYYFSTAAYQGMRGLDWREILEMNERFAPRPGLVLMFDLDPVRGLERVGGRGGGADHFERKADLEKVRALFRQIQGAYVHPVDASGTPEDVGRTVRRAVGGHLAARAAATPGLFPAEALRKLGEWAGG